MMRQNSAGVCRASFPPLTDNSNLTDNLDYDDSSAYLPYEPR